MGKSVQKETWESFFKRLEHRVSEDDLFRIELAYIISKHTHRHQIRKGEIDPATGKQVRYFEHPRRSAIFLMDVVGCYEPIVIIAILLHDAIEDSRGKITRNRLKVYFDQLTADIVHLVTKYVATKHRYVENLAFEADWRALLVKGCDRHDNLQTLAKLDPATIRKQIDETKEQYYPLLDLLVKVAPAKYAVGVKRLRTSIRRTVRDHERTLVESSRKRA